MVELADSLDSGSSVHYARAGSSPASRTIKKAQIHLDLGLFLILFVPIQILCTGFDVFFQRRLRFSLFLGAAGTDVDLEGSGPRSDTHLNVGFGGAAFERSIPSPHLKTSPHHGLKSFPAPR